jgi:hypothetical protein
MVALSDPLRDKIEAALRRGLTSPDTIIDVSSSGVRDKLHVLVVSRDLDNKTERQKQEFLWALLDDAVKAQSLTADELQRVSLVLPVSVDELRR